MSNRRRAAVNIVIPNRICQRGQIFTWTREVKAHYIDELKITAIVNFWPKLDSDLADLPLDWYWQIPAPRSEQMLEPRVQQAAEAVVDYLECIEGSNVLVLCEAGKTRSVFFCILLFALLQQTSYASALAHVRRCIPGISLKGFMLNWMEKEDAKW